MSFRSSCAMRHAVLYVTPSWRSNSFAATPWRVLVNSYMAKNHVVSSVLDFSKMVPTHG